MDLFESTSLVWCCRIQVFHCLQHDGTGGRTLLVDGFYAAEIVREQSPENFELLSRVPIRQEYLEKTGAHRNHMVGICPVFSVYPWNHEIYQIRYVSSSFNPHLVELWEAVWCWRCVSVIRTSKFLLWPRQHYQDTQDRRLAARKYLLFHCLLISPLWAGNTRGWLTTGQSPCP